MECYVFIDDSNLWIAGQKAQGKKMKDVDTDTRFRVDLGKFLHLLTNDRHVAQAFLFGSVPPPNDTVWKAAREKNYTVKTFQKSGSGREKEVDSAMVHEITKTMYTLESRENVTFIVVTGDRDLKPPILDALENGVPVELWSWEDAMARDFRQLANKNNRFTVTCLDSVVGEFSYTSLKSPHDVRNINHGHVIVYRGVPKGDEFLHMLADHLYRLMRLFYITSVCEEANHRDLIVEFPKTEAEEVFKKLPQLGSFEYNPISYPEYMQNREQHFTLKLTNRFQALTGIETEDFEAVLEAVRSSMNSQMEDIVHNLSHSDDAEEVTPTELDPTDVDDWETALRQTAGVKKDRSRRQKDIECKYHEHCAAAFNCPYKHSEYERKLFAKHSKSIRFKFFKTNECNKKDIHNTEEERKWCLFAHDSEDSWCIGCRMYGHLIKDCQVKK
jgi:uncharacterized LabA/DUF88 family protein